MKKLLFFVPLFSFAFSSIIETSAAFDSFHAYYISQTGNDNNDGSRQHPWKTLTKLSNTQLQPGDTVFIKGNDTLEGTLNLHHISGTVNLPVIIQTFGTANAIINAKNNSAIVADSCSYLSIHNITAMGSGRKNGNVKDGVAVTNCNHISITDANVQGFQKSGLLIHDCTDVEANNIVANNNGFAGIYVSGEYGDKLHCKNLKVINCKAENNPGDPTNFSNHSGNGILAGFCTNVLIEKCSATNNGWDMPRAGNGPVGIWCYEADSIVIQHCISYQNKTSKGGEDGGGYDFDGGVTHSLIQYCLSYGNAGSGFGIFQYNGASPWHDNTIRYCISENDGNVSAAHANAYIWNSSHDSAQFTNLLFYNNTIYNNANAVLSYSSESDHRNFRFYNNIFVANNELITGNYRNDIFIGNDWWSKKYGFKIDSITSFSHWAKQYNKEQLRGKLQGKNMEPVFKKYGSTSFTNPSLLFSFTKYRVSNLSALSVAGIDLQRLFHINTGNIDFNDLPLKRIVVGACAQKK